MKKLKKILSVLLVFLVLMGSYFTNISKVSAAAISCRLLYPNFNSEDLSGKLFAGKSGQTLKVKVSGLTPNSEYFVSLNGSSDVSVSTNSNQNGEITITSNNESLFSTNGLIQINITGGNKDNCYLPDYVEVYSQYRCGSVKIYQERNGKECRATANGCFDAENKIFVKTQVLDSTTDKPVEGVWIVHDMYNGPFGDSSGYSNADGFVTTEHSAAGDDGRYDLSVQVNDGYAINTEICKDNFIIDQESSCSEQQVCDETEPEDNEEIEEEINPASYSLCNQIPSSQPQQKADCQACTGNDSIATIERGEFVESAEGVWTAFGCIKKEPTSVIQQLIKIGLGMAGGFTLLTFLAAGFSYSTAQNDAKKTADAREQITAALIGLLFIIFSITILQFIGSSVLKIPGFGG